MNQFTSPTPGPSGHLESESQRTGEMRVSRTQAELDQLTFTRRFNRSMSINEREVMNRRIQGLELPCTQQGRNNGVKQCAQGNCANKAASAPALKR